MSQSVRTRVALAVAFALLAASARAQQAPATPAIDPAAVKALEGMAMYLRNLKSFSVESVTTTDEVLDDGQLAQYGSKVIFLVQTPNKLTIEVTSDRADRIFLYDGKSFTLYARRLNYYATIPAPPTLRELDDLLVDKYDIQIPLADLFRFGNERWKASDIKAAVDLGPAEAGGTTCQHYAFRQDDVDFQVWIQKGVHPLPRKLVITTTTDPSRPQFSATYTWNLAPSYNDESFVFVPPPDANKIVLATVDGTK